MNKTILGIDLKTREHLVYFIQCGKLKLSNYDQRFLQNLNYIITVNDPITSNQRDLFEKLVVKYLRQLNKHGLTPEFIAKLKWTVNIVPSDPLYTDAYISIQEGNILFRSPFNKHVLAEFRKIQNNSFIWDKPNKRYTAEYSTHALKIVVTTAKKYFASVHYCPIVKSLLDTISQYEGMKYWDPTLVLVNGNLFIAASNEILDTAIKDIPLTTDARTLAILSDYGIKVDSTIIQGDPKLKFASEYMPEINSQDISTMIDWLRELGCDEVYLLGPIPESMKEKLLAKLNEITFWKYTNDVQPDSNYPVIIQFVTSSLYHPHSGDVKKVIKIKNNMAIKIK